MFPIKYHFFVPFIFISSSKWPFVCPCTCACDSLWFLFCLSCVSVCELTCVALSPIHWIRSKFQTQCWRHTKLTRNGHINVKKSTFNRCFFFSLVMFVKKTTNTDQYMVNRVPTSSTHTHTHAVLGLIAQVFALHLCQITAHSIISNTWFWHQRVHY